jgi:hypothetical protein
MPKTRLSIPLNDVILSILQTGVEVSCEPPRVNAYRILVLLLYGNIGGSKVDSSPDRVPPPAWSHRPRNQRVVDGKTKDHGDVLQLTMVSPYERWNMWVFGRHRSTSVINAAESIIASPPVMRQASGRNPARRMNGMYCSFHIRGLCVRILSGDSRCGIQQ